MTASAKKSKQDPKDVKEEEEETELQLLNKRPSKHIKAQHSDYADGAYSNLALNVKRGPDNITRRKSNKDYLDNNFKQVQGGSSSSDNVSALIQSRSSRQTNPHHFGSKRIIAEKLQRLFSSNSAYLKKHLQIKNPCIHIVPYSKIITLPSKHISTLKQYVRAELEANSCQFVPELNGVLLNVINLKLRDRGTIAPDYGFVIMFKAECDAVVFRPVENQLLTAFVMFVKPDRKGASCTIFGAINGSFSFDSSIFELHPGDKVLLRVKNYVMTANSSHILVKSELVKVLQKSAALDHTDSFSSPYQSDINSAHSMHAAKRFSATVRAVSNDVERFKAEQLYTRTVYDNSDDEKDSGTAQNIQINGNTSSSSLKSEPLLCSRTLFESDDEMPKPSPVRIAKNKKRKREDIDSEEGRDVHNINDIKQEEVSPSKKKKKRKTITWEDEL